MTKDHDVQVAMPYEGTHSYNDLKPGTYFWGWEQEGPLLLRVVGGYVSLVNGNMEHDEHNAYFVGKKVWPIQDGAKVTINIHSNVAS